MRNLPPPPKKKHLFWILRKWRYYCIATVYNNMQWWCWLMFTQHFTQHTVHVHYPLSVMCLLLKVEIKDSCIVGESGRKEAPPIHTSMSPHLKTEIFVLVMTFFIFTTFCRAIILLTVRRTKSNSNLSILQIPLLQDMLWREKNYQEANKANEWLAVVFVKKK